MIVSLYIAVVAPLAFGYAGWRLLNVLADICTGKEQ